MGSAVPTEYELCVPMYVTFEYSRSQRDAAPLHVVAAMAVAARDAARARVVVRILSERAASGSELRGERE